MIALSECVKGHLYKVNSRNLELAVFDGETGFTGIREKFGDRFLFKEYHYDTGVPYGTVRPQEDLGPIPEGIEPFETNYSSRMASGNLFAYLEAKEKELEKGEVQ